MTGHDVSFDFCYLKINVGSMNNIDKKSEKIEKTTKTKTEKNRLGVTAPRLIFLSSFVFVVFSIYLRFLSFLFMLSTRIFKYRDH